ncbi:Aspercryptin biosynthesis cluster-specific transcription regulator atnN [Colletotrichum orbiculare MAFF 240422]|uniref:Aspercryptin biosynthesis cluster-specific transcription regulator atnN n=1 Tax=Colletotrichum orbiculare (strain 104-T / ATCC 96160 / CBS 514.97 / LARS 414 / MAFF 240422) TaxID=1213857 RepID=N4V2L1_COLOR|nr:Aspercryptin biosynthesis cluster-specific transcription regulator atnN [Colletotrichum orbiculare MAFF 240422]
MARKGSRKVRTGCLTCKIRKIKCDEGKPYCNRCTSTGRKCDGYSTETPSVIRWQRPQTLRFENAANDEEARALQNYVENVAPFIAGPTDPYFWTHLVVQFSNFEPAVRHSVVAISLLFEDLQNGLDPRLDEVALRHYNAAIFELKPVQNRGLVLIVCLLFVCIEMLRSNAEAAVRHYNHGLAILDSSSSQSWIRDHLVPIFRRLAQLPFLFSREPRLPDPEICKCQIPTSFTTFAQAQCTIDYIFNQTSQLARSAADYRAGGPLRGHAPAPDLVETQRNLERALVQWRALFDDLDARSSTAGNAPIRGGPRVYALLRYEVSRTRAGNAFDAAGAEGEGEAYDRHADAFRQVVCDAARYAQTQASFQAPQFLFEASFAPLLYWIVRKCRALDVRLEALRLVGVLGSPREMMWDKGDMYADCRRIIETEHNVALDGFGRVQMAGTVARVGLPVDTRHVSQPAKEAGWHHDAMLWGHEGRGGGGGGGGGGYPMGFYLGGSDDGFFMNQEVAGVDPLVEMVFDPAYDSYSSSPSSNGCCYVNEH